MKKNEMMELEKKEHYDISRLLEIDAEYNLLLSERSNGKSYQVKKKVIENFMNKKIKFIYLRRFVVDLKESFINSYFSDENIPYRKWTKGKYDGIMCYRGNLYFYAYEDDKPVRGELCGKYMALSAATHYKSMSLTEYKNIIFEEFVVESGGYDYLPNECDTLQQLVSTIARKEKVNVYMIGNTINSMCPYFRYWSLKNIPKQKSGTIDVYNMEYSDGVVRIAVEICKETNTKGKMFFGKVEKNINNGVWVSKDYPSLPYEYKECVVLYTVIWRWGDLCYKSEILKKGNHIFVYVRPCDINKLYNIKKLRYISDEFVEKLPLYRWHTKKFVIIKKPDKLLELLLSRGQVCFSDNLSGEEFSNIYEIYTKHIIKRG